MALARALARIHTPFPSSYATLHSPLILARPPNPPSHAPAPRPLDRFVLEALASTRSAERTALPQLIQQYLERSGNVLSAQLPYEPHPSPSRRVSFSTYESRDVHLVAHVTRESDRNKITVSSGFALDTSDGQSILVTCAHTLEEVCHSPCVLRCRSELLISIDPLVSTPRPSLCASGPLSCALLWVIHPLHDRFNPFSPSHCFGPLLPPSIRSYLAVSIPYAGTPAFTSRITLSGSVRNTDSCAFCIRDKTEGRRLAPLDRWYVVQVGTGHCAGLS